MKLVEVQKEFIFEEDRPFDSAHASTLLKLSGGGILAAWFGGSWEKGADTAIWISRRGGQGWEPPVCVTDARAEAMWNPVLFRRQNGTILLFYKTGESIPVWKTRVISSDDEGISWSAPRELVPGDCSGGRGPVKNKPIRLRNGTVLAPASLEGETWDAFADISRDDGETWEASEFVPLRRAGYNIQMVHYPYDKHRCFGKGVIQPTLWQDEAGEVHMLLRSTSSRIFRSDSRDGGYTWSPAYDTGLFNNNSGIDLAGLPDGRLVLVHNPTENLPGYHKGPRTPLVASLSEDNGESWRELAVLEDGIGGFSYPAVICGGENEICITYTWKRERIVFVRMRYEP